MGNISSGQQHGIPEVPNHLDPTTQMFLRQLKAAVVKNAGSPIPARPTSKIVITPIAGGNIIQWVMTDADSYKVYAAATDDISQATVLDAGQSNEFQHLVGAAAVKRFYWVQSCKGGVERNTPPVGPQSGTTLALGAGATVPSPPLSPDVPVIDLVTGHTQRSISARVPDLE